MKLTVFALLLVALAFTVLASIFRSGMKQFDQRPAPSLKQAAAISPWQSDHTQPPPQKKRLQPWLNQPSARSAPKEQAQEVVDVPVPLEEAEEMLEESQEPPATEVPSEDELAAWGEALAEREATFNASREEYQAWVDQQSAILEESQRLIDEQFELAQQDAAIEAQALLAQEELVAAAEQHRQALIEEEARFLLEEERLSQYRQQLEQFQLYNQGQYPIDPNHPGRPEQRPPSQFPGPGVTPRSGGGGGGFQQPIPRSAPPIPRSATPIPRSATPIPRSSTPLHSAPQSNGGRR